MITLLELPACLCYPQLPLRGRVVAYASYSFVPTLRRNFTAWLNRQGIRIHTYTHMHTHIHNSIYTHTSYVVCRIREVDERETEREEENTEHKPLPE